MCRKTRSVDATVAATTAVAPAYAAAPASHAARAAPTPADTAARAAVFSVLVFSSRVRSSQEWGDSCSPGEALQVMTSGSNSTLCSVTTKSSACCRCSPFSQALIAGKNTSKLLGKPSACCHCFLFSQALIEALQVETNKTSACCHCSPRSQTPTLHELSFAVAGAFARSCE